MATVTPGDRKTPPKEKPSDRHGDHDEVSGRSYKPTKEEEAREVNTPGDGTLPDPTPDGKADPGTG